MYGHFMRQKVRHSNMAASADYNRYLHAKQEILNLVEKNPLVGASINRHLFHFVSSMRFIETGCIQHERHRIDERIRNFDYERSDAWTELKRRGWDQLSQAELLSIAQILGKKLGIELDREAKRRKSILVKWFDENLTVLRSRMGNIDLVFEDPDDQRV